MKVLQLSKFFPPVPGGIEAVVHALAEGLNLAGCPSDVLCANTSRHTLRESAATGYSVTRAASLGKALSTAIAPSMVYELKKIADRYDIIHVQMPDPMAAFAIWAVRPKARVVLHWQSDVVSQKRALRFYAPLQDWLLRRADRIIATTNLYAAASPSLRQFAAKVEVIPIGIADPQRASSHEAARAVRDRFANRRLVFSLGRMTFYKGFEFLIEAAALLPRDAVVVVGGGGELLAVHRALVRARGLDDRIHFVGRIDDLEVPAYFAACDVFCLPSVLRSEAYGVVLLEAMAASKPIVATAIEGSGVPWVNLDGVTGVNVPVCDGAALAAALTDLLDHPDRGRALGAAGRARFEQLLTDDAMVDRMLDLYGRLLSDPARAPSS